MSDSDSRDLAGPAEPARTYGQAAVLGLFSLVFVLAAAVGWWVVDPVKYEVLAASRAGLPLREAALSALSARAALLGLAGIVIGGAVVLLVALELRRRAVSQAIETAPGRWVAVLAGSLLLWFGHAYLYPGWMLGGDASAHVARVVQLGLALRDGEWPIWSNRFYLGSPFLQFTGPLFFHLGGLMAALIGDGMLATKILLFALHLAGGFAAYALLRRLGSTRMAALAGMVAYAGAWAHLHLFVYSGVLPQALTLALLPVVFAAAESCLRQGGPGLRWNWAVLALGAAGLLATHQPHGLLAGLYLGGFCLWRWRSLGATPAALGRVLLAGGAGILAASYAIVPYLLERDTVMATGAAEVFTLRLPALADLAKLVLWSNGLTSTGQSSAAYLGVSAVLLAAIGCAAALRDAALGRRTMSATPYFALGLAVSLVVTGPFIRDVQFTLFFLAPLVARGVMALAGRGGAWAATVALGALAALLLDLGPTALQPLNRTDKAHYAAALDHLEARPQRGRVVLVGSGGWSHADDPGAAQRYVVNAGPSASPLAWGAVSFVNGPHNQTAAPAHNPAIAVLMRLERELNGAGVSEETRRLLALLGVDRVIYDDGERFGFPATLGGTVEDGPLGRVIALPEATRVLFATGLVPLVADHADRPLLWPSMVETAVARQAEAVALAALAALDPDFNRGIAAGIPVPAGTEAGIAPSAAEPAPEARLAVTAVEEGRQALRVALEVPGPGFVRLAYAWHPWLRVAVNGTATPPIRTLTGLVAIPVPAGPVEIDMRAEASSLRRGFTVVSAATVLGILALPIVLGRSQRGRPGSAPSA